jgi:hypothetical protein
MKDRLGREHLLASCARGLFFRQPGRRNANMDEKSKHAAGAASGARRSNDEDGL